MTEQDYIIVGRDVGEAKFHLVGDNILPAQDNPGGTPLDVVYMGKLIGEMSERIGEDRKASAEEIKLMRLCMRADSLPPGQFDEMTENTLIDNTEIQVIFETRTPGSCIHEDKNTRVLVVPADGTLKTGLEQLEMPVVGKPFEPPLTYPVDKNLMLSWMLDGIIEQVVNVESPEDLDNMSWHQIRKHFADEIEAQLIKEADEDKVSQIAAFHRAVGIYVTNMCR
ncbi:MAG: hypothetical protein GQ535_03185 [Rhodobacteraceae bacterium]|nr:hypothetical protein [Paracoccaceae bacterium]